MRNEIVLIYSYVEAGKLAEADSSPSSDLP